MADDSGAGGVTALLAGAVDEDCELPCAVAELYVGSSRRLGE